MSDQAWEFASDMAKGMVQLFLVWLALQIVWAGLRGKGLGF